MSEFSKAFRAARAAGKKVFSWNGKKYTTKLKAKAGPNKSPSSRSATHGPPSDKLQRAVDSASAKGKAATPAKPAPVQGPQPSKAVGIAKAGSAIANAAARKANAPVAKEKQGPQPAKAVGIAKSNSPIARVAARIANAPAKEPIKSAAEASKTAARSGVELSAAQKASVAQVTPKKSTPASAPEKQGPTPEGVWYAKKGSSISKAAARRANAPKVRAALAAKKK
ncbi:hypothetical protein [Rhizobium leguminosarum]|uniref:hypothetical protein n=1 Tax=Rhizobium leguminosarum TaxID=384 RepID=UPI001C93F9A7|nr:hypothetical protein [Rhizobium leguminosarum]MBY5581851.1 hypothetical protein [Rhizobium leguminosarum]